MIEIEFGIPALNVSGKVHQGAPIRPHLEYLFGKGWETVTVTTKGGREMVYRKVSE